MRIVFEVIAIIIIVVDFVMCSPLGLYWNVSWLDNNRPAYGWLFVFASAVPLLVIMYCLGWIH